MGAHEPRTRRHTSPLSVDWRVAGILLEALHDCLIRLPILKPHLGLSHGLHYDALHAPQVVLEEDLPVLGPAQLRGPAAG
jgi:hypothetical protein